MFPFMGHTSRNRASCVYRDSELLTRRTPTYTLYTRCSRSSSLRAPLRIATNYTYVCHSTARTTFNAPQTLMLLKSLSDRPCSCSMHPHRFSCFPQPYDEDIGLEVQSEDSEDGRLPVELGWVMGWMEREMSLEIQSWKQARAKTIMLSLRRGRTRRRHMGSGGV